MKKTVLLLLMLLLCSTAATAATYYGFKIGDVKVTSDNYTNVTGDNIIGSVKYDPSTKTVTLTNVTITLTGSYKRALINESHDGVLTVELVGSNTLSAVDAAAVRLNSGTSMAIYMTDGSTTQIQSTDEEGIWVTSNSNYHLEIGGPGKLYVRSNSKAAIASDNSAILLIDGNVYCSGAKGAIDWKHQVAFHNLLSSPCVARFAATNNSSYPVIKAGEISFLESDISIVRPSGAKVNAAGTQIVTSSGSTIYNQDILITANGVVTIDEINFPDDLFRSYMGVLYPKGYMTQAEVNNLTTLNVASMGIANMKGIEKLTALKELHCYNNSFPSLDLSSNTALTYLDCCSNRQLTSLNVASCTNLETLRCSATGITSLNVSNLSKLKILRCDETKLTSLTVTGKSQLASLYCKNCTSLTNLTCYNNALTTLDVTGNTALKDLRCYENANLASITGLADCTAITYLDCEDCKISDLSAVNSMGNLQQLYARNNKLTTFTLNGKSSLTYVRLSGNTSLTTATIYGNSKLATLYITGCTALATLNCYVNALTSLDVTGNTALKDLRCYENANLSTITGLANCKAITYLNCEDCAITDLSACNSMTKLQQLYARNNKLTSFTLTNKSNLTYIRMSGNTSLATANISGNRKLVTLGISGCTGLKTLNCSYNALTGLDLTGNTAITSLNCSKNALTSLNVSPLTRLADLKCYGNSSLSSITGLANSASTLTYLSVDDCKLTTLDVSSLSKLQTLYCYNNRITSLNVQGKTALETLYCDGNQLTSLYVQGCTALKYLDCYNNKFTDAGMTTLVNSLPARTAAEKGTLKVLDNTNENNVFTDTHRAVAAAKNWDPYRYTGSSWVVISANELGDMNGDGDIDVADVTMLIGNVLSGTSADSSVADVNGDGDIDVADVTMLIQRVLSGTW